jgi:hypothetical protein
MSGIEFHRYDFWVGSWVGECAGPVWRSPINPDELDPGMDFAALRPAWPTLRRSTVGLAWIRNQNLDKQR